MSATDEQRVLKAVNSIVGRWALGILISLASLAFGLGVWVTGVRRDLTDSRTQNWILSKRLEETNAALAQQTTRDMMQSQQWFEWRIAITRQVDNQAGALALQDNRITSFENRLFRNQ